MTLARSRTIAIALLFLASCAPAPSAASFDGLVPVQLDEVSVRNWFDKEAIVSAPALASGWHENLEIDGIAYDLYIPADYNQNGDRPALLVLPGWDFSRRSWVENSDLVGYADKYGYALILPEMGITLYESAFFPETDPAYRWHDIPGGQFVRERLIPTLQNRHGLLQPGSHNTLLGLSTGGRGVALIALENPNLFVAGAALSGDFSQENTPRDRLMAGVYGSYSQFSDRWTGRDNPQARSAQWQMPLYLAHGTEDAIVPETQSRLFYEAIVESHGEDFPIVYNAVVGAVHDYSFWGGQLDEVFNFLEKHRQSLRSNSEF